MAGATLPSYDTMNHHALSFHCKSRGLEVPKDAFNHKLIEILARDHLQKDRRRRELESFDAVNDPEGTKRTASMLQSRRVEEHFVGLELQSLADFNRHQSQIYKEAQEKAEEMLEKKMKSLSLYWENSLNANAEKVKAEQLARATAQANG